MPFQTFARLFCCLTALALVSACATKPQMSAQSESTVYRSRASRNYTPPGPPSDPWGPYVKEAAAKFDIPDRWIREVMRQESGGKLFNRSGDLVTSGAGAMGLMQVMPGTYDELRARYPDLGDDPYDPHNNIMAGTAYLREMFDIYGSPGFLAAYNAGPGRLDDYLTRNRTLPEETRRYVANIGPRIAGVEPQRPSPGAQYAMNNLPAAIPSGTRYASAARYSAPPAGPIVLSPQPVAPIVLAPVAIVRASVAPTVQVAQLPEPPRAPYIQLQPPPPARFAQLPEPPTPTPFEPAARSQAQFASAALVPAAPRGSRFALVSQANAEPIGSRRAAPVAGAWAVQVGAFANQGLATSTAAAARDHARDLLGSTRTSVTSVKQAHGVLYRARLTGLSRDAAAQACERLARTRTTCMLVSPDAQS